MDSSTKGYLIFFGVVALALLYKLFRPTILGKSGEARVKSLLSGLPDNEYKLLNDVLLQTERGTTQIDHVLVSIYGIFVIETKNYSGWITGSRYGDEWTKNMYGKKYRFRNPLKQNYGHVKALENKLGLPTSCFIPLVVFSRRATLKVEADESVLYTSELLKTIKGYREPLLSSDEAERIARKIESMSMNSKESKKAHVNNVRKNIRDAEQKVRSGICPKCGGDLVLRNGRYGKFYGCSNYPKCRCTKQI